MASDDVAELVLGLVDTLRESSHEDPVNLLTLGCLTLPTVVRAGLVLTAFDGGADTTHGSDDTARELVEHPDGPARTCLRSGEQLVLGDSCTLPMRCGGRTLGALTLFADAVQTGDGKLVRFGQTLADAAATVVVIRREVDHNRATVSQLQTALISRIGIEQAKGVMAGRLGLGMDEAFRILREYARAHNRRLADLAADVVEGAADPVVIRSRVLSRNRRDPGPSRRARRGNAAQLSEGSDG
jgi:hypothetical protein